MNIKKIIVLLLINISFFLNCESIVNKIDENYEFKILFLLIKDEYITPVNLSELLEKTFLEIIKNKKLPIELIKENNAIKVKYNDKTEFIDFSYDADSKEFYTNLNKMNEIIYKSNKNKEIDKYYIIDHILINLDEYCSLEIKDSLINNENVGGIGALIKKNEKNECQIVCTYENSASMKAGLKPGDIIIKIDDREIDNLTINEIADLLKGDISTDVNLKILREDKLLDFKIIRNIVDLASVRSENYDNILYIKINQLDNNISVELDKIIKNNKKIHLIIMDLRNCPGGLLKEATSVCKNFIPKNNKVFALKWKKDIVENVISKNINNFKGKIAVLVNEGTSSGAEIIASALKDNNIGIIIGNKTFGYGTVQSLFVLNEKYIIKLTVSKLIRANGEDLDKIGIEPDIIINNEDGKDNQLDYAINYLKRKILN